MYGLIRKSDGVLECVVHATDGHDLTPYDVHELPAGDPMQYRWNGSAFVVRDPTPAEETAGALTADPRWAALKAASPAQIDTWLTANVTDVASARRVLKVLLLAVQALARTR